MSENKSLFRKKSLEQFTAPEQLNDYIHISRPSVVLVLAAVIAFLAGVIVWGFLGTIDSKVSVKAVADEGTLTAYIPESYASDLSERSFIVVGDSEFSISVTGTAMRAENILDSNELALFDVKPEERVIALSADTTLPDGSYNASVVMERLRPADLVLN